MKRAVKTLLMCVILLVFISSMNVAYADLINIDTIYNNVKQEFYNVSYYEAAEKLVEVINDKSSYLLPVRNPQNIEKYLDSLGIYKPDDTDKNITRLQLSRLIFELTSKMHSDMLYNTELIDIDNIFSDLDNLSDYDKECIKRMYASGILVGNGSKFNPHDDVSLMTMKLVLNRLNNGYSRKHLFNSVNSGFSQDDISAALAGQVNRKLTTYDVNSWLNSMGINISDTDHSTCTIGRFLEIYTSSLGIFVQNIGGEYKFIGKNNVFLTAEEWDYLESNQGKVMTYGEFLVIKNRYDTAYDILKNNEALNDIDNMKNLIDNFFWKYSSLFNSNLKCAEFFITDNNSFYTFNHFVNTMHEIHHEASAKLSGAFHDRTKKNSSWSISWSYHPYTMYYFDISNGKWITCSGYNYPKTSQISSKLPFDIRSQYIINRYCTEDNIAANEWGIKGLANEFVSFTIDTDVGLTLSSLKFDRANALSSNLRNCRLLKNLLLEYIIYLNDADAETYNNLMNQTDFIRLLNNYMRDIDNYLKLYNNQIDPFTSINIKTWEIGVNNRIKTLR